MTLAQQGGELWFAFLNPGLLYIKTQLASDTSRNFKTWIYRNDLNWRPNSDLRFLLSKTKVMNSNFECYESHHG